MSAQVLTNAAFMQPPKKHHRKIKGRFRKRVVLANVPSFQFSFQGNMRTYPRSGFRSGENPNVPSFRFSFRGTSAKTTLLETTLLGSSELPPNVLEQTRNLFGEATKTFLSYRMPHLITTNPNFPATNRCIQTMSDRPEPRHSNSEQTHKPATKPKSAWPSKNTALGNFQVYSTLSCP